MTSKKFLSLFPKPFLGYSPPMRHTSQRRRQHRLGWGWMQQMPSICRTKRNLIQSASIAPTNHRWKVLLCMLTYLLRPSKEIQMYWHSHWQGWLVLLCGPPWSCKRVCPSMRAMLAMLLSKLHALVPLWTLCTLLNTWVQISNARSPLGWEGWGLLQE